MTNKEIGSVLKETSALIELTGGNPFRSRAMANAGRTISRLEEPVENLISAGRLTEIRGIGAGLADQVSQLIETGSFDVREELLSAIPPGLLDMLAVKGLGARKVRSLWKEMGIQTLDELEAAAAAGMIAGREGFGKKTEESIVANIAALRRYRQRRHYADARLRATELSDMLAALPGVRAVESTGELRRKLETVGRIEVLVSIADGDLGPFLARLEEAVLSGARSTNTTEGPPRILTRLPDGFPLMISTTAPETFGSALFELTGSERFLAEWRARYGEAAAADSEARIFADSGLPEIPPELREDEAAIDLAENELLPVLIEEADLKGTLHNHSTYSDGAHTLDEMVMAARAMGLSYFGICDHSQSLKIANGLTVDDVRRQQEEIRALNERLQSADPPFRIFSGTESDILADGSLDYPDDVLASFDFVVASVHVGFNMTESQATERVVRAVENPHTRILGHPTGRLLLRREGYPLDHEAVLDACARNRVAVELNANPYRLDLDWRRIRMATEKGVLISINPDAHAIDQLAYTKWGIAVARKGGLTIESCLNAMSLEDFAAWISSRRT